MIASKAKYFAVEDLNISTRGNRGALAKAITSMPDGKELYVKACAIASEVLQHKVELVLVDPRYTSKIHYNCGGTLNRTNGKWDIAICNRCGLSVNTHLNASHNICEKARVKLAS